MTADLCVQKFSFLSLKCVEIMRICETCKHTLRGCRCATSWCDLDLISDLAVVTLTFNICPGYISETVKCRKLILGRDIGYGCTCATSLCDLHLIFHLAIVTLTFKILSRLYFGNRKV